MWLRAKEKSSRIEFEPRNKSGFDSCNRRVEKNGSLAAISDCALAQATHNRSRLREQKHKAWQMNAIHDRQDGCIHALFFFVFIVAVVVVDVDVQCTLHVIRASCLQDMSVPVVGVHVYSQLGSVEPTLPTFRMETNELVGKFALACVSNVYHPVAWHFIRNQSARVRQKILCTIYENRKIINILGDIKRSKCKKRKTMTMVKKRRRRRRQIAKNQVTEACSHSQSFLQLAPARRVCMRLTVSRCTLDV